MKLKECVLNSLLDSGFVKNITRNVWIGRSKSVSNSMFLLLIHNKLLCMCAVEKAISLEFLAGFVALDLRALPL